MSSKTNIEPKFSDYMKLNTPIFKEHFEPNFESLSHFKKITTNYFDHSAGYQDEDWFENYYKNISLYFNRIATKMAKENNYICDYCGKHGKKLYYIFNLPMREVLDCALCWFFINANQLELSCTPINLSEENNVDDIIKLCMWFQMDKTTPDWNMGNIVCCKCMNEMKLDFEGLDSDYTAHTKTQ